MAELEVKVTIRKTVWFHILQALAGFSWANALRKSIARFVEKHKLCVCMFEAGNTLTFYTIAIDGEEIKVIGMHQIDNIYGEEGNQ